MYKSGRILSPFEGEIIYKKPIETIKSLLEIFDYPVIVKEVGQGIGPESLRELMKWGIVNKMHVKGERKEFFTTEQNVWELFKIILRERKKREIVPTLEVLHDLIDTLEETNHADKVYVQQQLESLLAFVESGTDLYDYTSNLNPLNLMQFSKQTLKLAQKVVAKDH